MKNQAAKLLARLYYAQSARWKNHPIQAQQKVFRQLIHSAQNTQFGKDHDFAQISTYEDYKSRVPIRDYEQLNPYIQKVVAGEENILWKGKPMYFAKTSGTTSGAKLIPISKESMPYHIKAARGALLNYIYQSGNAQFVNGKLIFLQGSPVLEKVKGIPAGRLSGIVAHHVPAYLQSNRMPSWETNCIEDWEEKVAKIVDETIDANMTLMSGIPPWLIMYFEKLQEKRNQPIGTLFPNLQVLVTGGVNYEPYRQKIQEFMGRKIDVIQTFPASEGFFAYQDELDNESLLLLTAHGIFYEFVPLHEIHKENPTRLSLEQVELNVDYALIISTNAGLWAYNIGDTVRFVNKNPYKLVVSGRTKHYTSAFGEHVIAHEVEKALERTLQAFPCKVSEFHVAPQVNPAQGLPYHEWFVEFDTAPADKNGFVAMLNTQMCELNAYYDDLIQGSILRPLVLQEVPTGGFVAYMKSQGKLGGQNKVPRLANDRKIADFLSEYTI